MIDSITDMLNRIRSAKTLQKEEVLVPFSKIKFEIANILSKDGFVGEVKKVAKSPHQKIINSGKGKRGAIKIVLKYENGVSIISGLKRVSKSGQRIYSKSSELKKIHGGYGISIISTPKGLMTNKEARKQKLGGEVLLEVW